MDVREVTGSSRGSEGSVVAIPEESPTVAKGGVRGAGSGVRVGRGRVPVWRVVFSSRFVQGNGPGGAVDGGGEDLKKGLIRGPEQAGVEGGSSRSCTLVVLSSRTAPEEPLATAEGFDLGLDAGDRGRPPHREGTDYYAHYNFVHLLRIWRSRRGSRRGESGYRVGSRDLGRGGNRGSRRQELVTIEVQVIATLLDLGGANRGRRRCPKVP
jgi:hypothetical protein